MESIIRTDVPGLALVNRGKVRDVYEMDGKLLLVATDRISAFDVVLPDPIPGKGVILTALSNFWFDRTKSLVPNHIEDPAPWRTRAADPAFAGLKGRAVLAKKANPLPIEAVVRGYLAGSGWSEYRQRGTVCGIPLPAGLIESAKLPEPIFTPATKAPHGQHDVNISFDRAAEIVGRDVAERVRDLSIWLYTEAAAYAAARGLIIADTKFEFGTFEGNLIVIDEMLTPDSSRFWPLDGYTPGRSQPSFDKQFVRDYLLTLNWNKQAPAPNLPPEIVAKTAEKYREALARLDPGNEALGWL